MNKLEYLAENIFFPEKYLPILIYSDNDFVRRTMVAHQLLSNEYQIHLANDKDWHVKYYLINTVLCEEAKQILEDDNWLV